MRSLFEDEAENLNLNINDNHHDWIEIKEQILKEKLTKEKEEI